MNERLLEDLGLTRGEVVVYQTLLKLGETTTGKIVDEAGISSGKIYEILEKLIRKGLASYIVKEKTKYFRAASPQRILEYVREKEKALKVREKELEKEMPALFALQKNIPEHGTTLFKGLKGFRTAIFESLSLLNQTDIVLGMGVLSTKGEEYNLLWEQWHRERVKRKIACKILFSDSNTEYYNRLKHLKYVETRVLQRVTPAAVDVLGRRVLILTHGEQPSCLVIENEQIAQSFRSFFESLWKTSQRETKKSKEKLWKEIQKLPRRQVNGKRLQKDLEKTEEETK